MDKELSRQIQGVLENFKIKYYDEEGAWVEEENVLKNFMREGHFKELASAITKLFKERIDELLCEAKLSGIVARAYCTEENKNKIVDPALLMAIVKLLRAELRNAINTEGER
jgi:hypothetical protein